MADTAFSPAGADDDFHAVIVAGDPNGSPPDSPANRVDPNLATSPFAGVGSLQINAKRGTYICTATAIDDTHVLTAGHCIDLNSDGRSNTKDGIQSIQFHLNLDLDNSTDLTVPAVAWTPHPDFTGFNRPSINDDLAVITLGASLPTEVPRYALSATPMTANATHLYLVGYGRSGDGVSGYTTNASWTIKRHGENIVDAFYDQDDAGQPSANEVFRFDFDGPSGNGPLGGSTLGNARETTLGGGDSGGPSLILIDSAHPELAESYELVGVNTFTQGRTAPKFGSLGGGINIVPYRDWILGVSATSSLSSLGGTGGRGGQGSVLDIAVASLPLGAQDGASLVSAAAWSSPALRTEALLLSGADRTDSFTFAAVTGTQAALSEPLVVVVPSRSRALAEDWRSSDDETDEAVDRIVEEWLTDEEA
jgi:trypsin